MRNKISHLYRSSVDSSGAPDCGEEDYHYNEAFNDGLRSASTVYEKEIQGLESKLARAVECIEQIYEEIKPDEGDEVDFLYSNIFEYCRKTLVQLNGEGEEGNE